METFRFIILVTAITFLIIACKESQTSEYSNQLKEKIQVKELSQAAKDLAHFNAQLSPMDSPYKNKSRANLFLNQAANTSSVQKFNLEMRGAYEYLLAGRTKEAIGIFLRLKQILVNANINQNNEAINMIDQFLAVSYLRLGEQANCINYHSSGSCIIPLDDDSKHQIKEGSQKAIEQISLMLNKGYDDENYIYLLNIAYMTLGQYPDGVPKKWLRNLMNKEKPLIPKFQNKASSLNLDDNRLSGGVVIDDFNNDYIPDVVLTSWSLDDKIRIFFGRENGQFEESNDHNLRGINGGLNLTHTDYNNDGYLDLYILRGAWLKNSPVNSLLRNNGDETFTDVTHGAGLATKHPTQACTWADYNSDGYVDLFIANESSLDAVHSCELFINQKDGTFKDEAVLSSIDLKIFAKGVSSADYDLDGDVDIFISNLKGKNALMQNQLIESGQMRFINIASFAGVEEPMESFPTWFFDLNNDGWEDLFVSGYSESAYNNFAQEWSSYLNFKKFNASAPKVYINNKNGQFIDMTSSYNFNSPCFAMGANYGDINNDSYLDIYLATGEPDFKAIIPNRMFLNIKGNKFEEVTTQGGFGSIQKGHAVSISDIDNDGDEDIYCVLGGAYEGDIFFNALFENPIVNKKWKKLKLIGTKSNKAAIGARVMFNCSYDNKQTCYYRTISNSSSFGENSFTINFSIPENQNLEKIVVYWPSGNIQEIIDLPLNNLTLVTEMDDQLNHINLKSFKIPNSQHKHHHD